MTITNLPRSLPEQQGVASSAILRFVEALDTHIKEVHSFMLLRHGYVIAEGWWSPYAPDYPHMLFSLSKSFTSTAVGLAVAQNYISLDDTVLSFFPDDAPDDPSEFLQAMQVRHLLSMSTGQAEDSWAYMVDRTDGNWIKGFMDVPVLHPPGIHFVYNTGATYMLSAILQQCTGMTLLDYLDQNLFPALGIHDATWDVSPQGIALGGIGLKLKTEDIARFGQFYLQEGEWQGKQLLPKAWIHDATRSQISNSDGVQADWTQGYGYQFWRCRHQAYRGDGVFGQYCIVMPEQDAVLAITGGMDVFDMQQPLNLLWDNLLPAMQSDSLPEDTVAYTDLAHKLDSLSLASIDGNTHSPIASHISGQHYAVDDNTLSIQAITFDFGETTCEIKLQTDDEQVTILCGYDRWQVSDTALFTPILLFDETKVASRGAWTADDTFTILFRLYETPFYYTMVCHFADDELLMELQINVSLEAMNPLVMTATRA